MQEKTKEPEIRFAGFTGAWEQRKLGTIVQITMGQSPDGSTYSDTPALSVKITFATLSVLHGVVKHAIFAGVYR